MNILKLIGKNELRYYIIEEIVSHALSYFAEVSANPQDNIKLSELGYKKLNKHLLYLCSIGIVTYDCQEESDWWLDILRYEWTNYILTDEGYKLAKTDGALRNALKNHIRIPNDKFSEQFQKLEFLCADSNISLIYREDFLATLREIWICYDHSCYKAAIALCLQIIELCFVEFLVQQEVDCGINPSMHSLTKLIKDRVDVKKINTTMIDMIEIMSKYRYLITNLKAARSFKANSENITVPSKQVAKHIIKATHILVEDNLSLFLEPYYVDA